MLSNNNAQKVYTVTYYRFKYECGYCYDSGDLEYNDTVLGVFTCLQEAKQYSEHFLHIAAKCLEHNICGHLYSDKETEDKEEEEEEECPMHAIPYTKCYYCSSIGEKKNCRMCQENALYYSICEHENITKGPLKLNTFKWQVNQIDPDMKTVFDPECHPALCIQILPFTLNTPTDCLSSFHYTDSIYDDLTFTSFNSWLYCCYAENANGKKCCEHASDTESDSNSSDSNSSDSPSNSENTHSDSMSPCLSSEVIFKCTRRWYFEYLQDDLQTRGLYTRDMQDILRYIIYPLFLQDDYLEEETDGTEEIDEDENTEEEDSEGGEDNHVEEEEDDAGLVGIIEAVTIEDDE